MKNKNVGFETRAIHAGQEPDPATGAIMTPIYLSSTYVQASPGVHKGYEYSRTSNPTRRAFEDCMASLEGGDRGFATASGCAATLLTLHLLDSNSHVIAGDDMYGGTFRLFDKVLSKRSFEFSYVDMTDLKSLEAAIKKNTRLIWLETPTNPLLKIFDIEAIASIAKKHNILVAVDNTFMSPYFQQPLALGADIVVHSSTKYLNGHSDIVGGVIVTKTKDLSDQMQFLANSMGPVASTLDAFMSMRSVKTLAVRMRAHNENAQKIAEFLVSQPKVEEVIYPGLPKHPQHALARRQMRGFGGMVSVYIRGGIAETREFMESLRVFSLAESLGGVESLANHPAIMTHASVPAEIRKKLRITDNMVRLSVGIETVEDLLEDLKSALSQV